MSLTQFRSPQARPRRLLGDLDPRLLLVVAVAVGVWLPIVHAPWFWGHEKYSYIYRTVEWAAEMRRGLLYPRWCPDLYGGYGSPLFMFYAPVPYGSAGLLTAAFFSPVTALKIVALVVSVVSGLAMYALVFVETRQRDASLLAALVYLAAPYRIADLFERGDIGEFTSLALLPIAIALYRASALEAQPRRARWLAAAGALFHALLLMTHPILGFWSTVILGGIVGVTAIGLARKGLRQRALFSLGAYLCAPGMAAVYILPAMIYRHDAQIEMMATGWFDPQHQWLKFSSLFHDPAPYYSVNFFKIGPLVVGAIFFVLLGLALNFRRGLRALGWIALAVALIGLTLPEGSWFWLPGRIPTAQFIQFPWRLLGPAVVASCVALGIGMAAASERWESPIRNGIAIVCGAAMLLGCASEFVAMRERGVDGVPMTPELLRSGVEAALDDDGYLPRGAHPPTATRRDLVVSAEGAAAESVISDGSRHGVTVRADRPGAKAVLGLHAFPGWKHETVSGPGQVRMDADAQGLLRLEFPSAGTYSVRVWYGSAPMVRVGWTLSILFSMILALLLAWEPLQTWRRARLGWPWRLATGRASS